MTAQATITGRISDPELRHTPQGKAVLELRICATRRAKDKTTGEWGDDGAPLWIGATFWEREAENIAATVGKGDSVSVTGDLVLEEYTTRDGGKGSKLVVRFPRFLGVVPKAGQQSQSQSQASYAQPASDDSPWGAPAAPTQPTFTQDAPF